MSRGDYISVLSSKVKRSSFFQYDIKNHEIAAVHVFYFMNL